MGSGAWCGEIVCWGGLPLSGASVKLPLKRGKAVIELRHAS